MLAKRLDSYSSFQEVKSLINDQISAGRYIEEIENSLELKYLNRLDKWLIYFNANFEKSMCIYTDTVLAILNASLNNQLFRTQTTHEFETSLAFYDKLLKGKYFIFKIDAVSAEYLLNLCLIAGKYPGMIRNSVVKAIGVMKGDVIIQKLQKLFQTLFIRYENTEILTHNISRLTLEEMEAIMHMSQGKNIRNFEKLPLPLSKKESFIFINELPKDLEFRNQILKRAIIAAKLMSTNRDSDTLKSFLSSSRTFKYRLDQFCSDIKFWKRAYELICDADENFLGLTVLEYVDYFEFKKYHENQEYSLKGRTIYSVSNAIHNWHENAQFQKNLKLLDLTWEGSKTPVLKVKFRNETYSFKEITEGWELYQESQKLKHCAFSYINSCHRGYTSLWSLKKEVNSIMSPLITIEVIGNNIVQIAGEYNRLADSNEMDLIKQWAENKELNISENLLAV